MARRRSALPTGSRVTALTQRHATLLRFKNKGRRRAALRRLKRLRPPRVRVRVRIRVRVMARVRVRVRVRARVRVRVITSQHADSASKIMLTRRK